VTLFAATPANNLLPGDGAAHYYGPILARAEADQWLATLLHEVPWRHDETVIFGKRHVTARQVAWYGDADYAYTYSGTTHRALPWTAPLRDLKQRVEKASDARFNSCLLNLYHHGGEGMGWHSDNESSLVRHAAIASLSLGAERRFCFKHKHDGRKAELRLEHGSLLVMAGAAQECWRHSLPKMARVSTPRINLTFRLMREGE
jgi:alkylated DNA repair dioxygenase AlkB